MIVRGRGWFAAPLAALVLGSAAGCGSEEEPPPPEPRHALTQVVHRLQDRFEAEDVEGICALMARRAQTQAGKVAHATPTTCAKDVRKVLGMIDKGGGWLDADKPRVAAVREGADPTATLAVGDWRGEVPFVREDGEWRLAGFFGADPKRFERFERGYPRRPFPPERGAVKVTREDGAPCGPTSDAKYPRITGGCVVRVTAKSVPVHMITPFGGFKFSDCSVDYRVYVDSEGRTWTDEWEVEGTSESGCSDINPCIRIYPDGVRVDRLPWKGRIVPNGDGGFTHRMDMCVRTCVGNFVGDLVLDLESGDASAGWRVEQTDDGESGFLLDESMDVEGEPIEIAAAEPAG
jgi:hypothetical protein